MQLAVVLILLALPLLELVVLIKTAQAIGFWPTIGIMVGTAAIGIAVLYDQGASVLRRASQTLGRGTTPIGGVIDGSMRFLGGALLVSPGLLCDVAGLMLLVPPVRRTVAVWTVRRMLAAGAIDGETAAERRRKWRAHGDAGPRRDEAPGPIIEGEFERIGETAADQSRRPRPRD